MKKTIIQNKKIIIIAMAIAVILGSSVGYFQYQKLIVSTRNLYYSIELPTEKELQTYDAEETFAYQNLLDVKELAFQKLDVTTLERLQQEFVLLDSNAQTRRILKYFKDKTDEVGGLSVAGARDDESKQFHDKQQELLDILSGNQPIPKSDIIQVSQPVSKYSNTYQSTKERIDKLIEELKALQKQTLQDMSDRLAKEEAERVANEQASQASSSSSSYSGYDGYTPSYSGDGSYTPSYPSGGGSTTPSGGGGYDPGDIDEEDIDKCTPRPGTTGCL